MGAPDLIGATYKVGQLLLVHSEINDSFSKFLSPVCVIKQDHDLILQVFTAAGDLMKV